MKLFSCWPAHHDPGFCTTSSSLLRVLCITMGLLAVGEILLLQVSSEGALKQHQLVNAPTGQYKRTLHLNTLPMTNAFISVDGLYRKINQ